MQNIFDFRNLMIAYKIPQLRAIGKVGGTATVIIIKPLATISITDTSYSIIPCTVKANPITLTTPIIATNIIESL